MIPTGIRRVILVVCVVLFITSLTLGVWAFFIEPDLLVIHQESIAIPNWRPEQDGLRIAILTDLHVGSPHISLKKLATIVDRTNELKPDLVVILGDTVVTRKFMVTYRPDIEPIAAELGRLQPNLATLAVLGNHDWWYDGPRVNRALTAAHMTVLQNQAIQVSFRGKLFWVGGVGDFRTRHNDLAKTLRSVETDDPIILLTHNPDVFPAVPERVSLMLAGHTHGGQVNFPLLGRLIVPSRFGQRYAAGHIVEGGRHLFVSTGIGTSMIPVRFRVPPEIVLLEIRHPTD